MNPVVETADVVATIASAETLDEAADLATRDMADLLSGASACRVDVATMLMSAAGELQVSQVVDPLKTARFALPKSIIARSAATAVTSAPAGAREGGRDDTRATEPRAWSAGCAAW